MDEYINDFDIRVWNRDVFINGKNISYWSNDKSIGLQCNVEEGSNEYKSVAAHCEKIREDFIELCELLKNIEQ